MPPPRLSTKYYERRRCPNRMALRSRGIRPGGLNAAAMPCQHEQSGRIARGSAVAPTQVMAGPRVGRIHWAEKTSVAWVSPGRPRLVRSRRDRPRAGYYTPSRHRLSPPRSQLWRALRGRVTLTLSFPPAPPRFSCSASGSWSRRPGRGSGSGQRSHGRRDATPPGQNGARAPQAKLEGRDFALRTGQNPEHLGELFHVRALDLPARPVPCREFPVNLVPMGHFDPVILLVPDVARRTLPEHAPDFPEVNLTL